MGRSTIKQVFLILLAIHIYAFSQDALDSRLKHQDQQRSTHQFLVKNADFICSASRYYNVSYGSLLYILDYQHNSYDEREQNQQFDAALKSAMRKRVELEKTYQKHSAEDLKRAMNCDLNEKRNSISTGDDYFSSLGPAQIQVYVATMIYEKILKPLGIPRNYPRDHPFVIRSSPSGWPYAEDIVPHLFLDEGAIVFLAGEIRYMQDTFLKSAHLNIYNNAKMILELHTGGNILNRARLRQEAQDQGKPKPVPQVLELSHLTQKLYPSKLCP